MSHWKPTTPCIALIAATLAACGPDREPAPATETAVQPQIATQAMAGPSPLPQEVIDRLKAEYPVLRRDTAPEPQPSPDADPSVVPERVQAALAEPVLETVTGEATFYADSFEGRRTASGIPFRQHQMVAAHRAYPFGTILRVTNLRNDREVNVRVVDRGPHGSRAAARNTIIDLSRRAAQTLDYVDAGRTPVRVEVLEWGEGLPRSG